MQETKNCLKNTESKATAKKENKAFDDMTTEEKVVTVVTKTPKSRDFIDFVTGDNPGDNPQKVVKVVTLCR